MDKGDKMSDIGKKIVLDSDYVDMICEKYKANRDKISEVENHSCFSSPDLDQHSCVYPRSHKGCSECNYCHHNDELWQNCLYVCQISHVCLAAYLTRLGYRAGEDHKKVVKDLLTMDYKELVLEIDSLLANDKEVREDLVEEVSEEIFDEIMDEVFTEDVEEPKDLKEEYVSVRDAAEYINKSLPSMYKYIRDEKVEVKQEGKKKMVKVSSLEKFIKEDE
jgi:hypothetical protein